MTVAELVDKLSKAPDWLAEVIVEGCDCVGDLSGVSVLNDLDKDWGEEKPAGTIVLRRSDGPFSSYDRDRIARDL